MTEKKIITPLDLTKVTKILTKKIQCNGFFFSFQSVYGQHENF